MKTLNRNTWIYFYYRYYSWLYYLLCESTLTLNISG